MDTITLFEKSLMLVVVISAPAVLITTTLGVLISLLQGLFQVQDQTLAFAVKLVAMALTLAATGAWMGGELINLSNAVFEHLPYVRK